MTDVPVVLACGEQRREALTAALRAVPGVHLLQTLTVAAQVPRAVADLGRGVLLLDGDVPGGAVALVRAVMTSAPVPILVLAPGLPDSAVAALLRAGAVEVRTREGLHGLGERCKVLAGVGVVRRLTPAPACSPRSRSRSLAREVRTRTAVPASRSDARIASVSAKPSITGISTSVSTRSAGSCDSRPSASCPWPAVRTW